MSTYQSVHSLPDPAPARGPAPVAGSGKDDHSMKDVVAYLGELFSRLTSDLGELFSLHMDLLKAEARDSVKTLARDSALMITGAVLGLFAFWGLTLALMALIAGLLPIENALLAFAAGTAIVGVLYAIIAGALVMAGIKHLQKRSLAPDRTIQEIKRDKEAVKEIR
jgi:hypothetical protein